MELRILHDTEGAVATRAPDGEQETEFSFGVSGSGRKRGQSLNLQGVWRLADPDVAKQVAGRVLVSDTIKIDAGMARNWLAMGSGSQMRM